MSQFSRPHEIILEGNGLEWKIKFEQVNTGYTSGQMTLKMQTIHEEKLIGCVPFSISYSDLVRLADYFDHHVKQLSRDAWSDSDVFVQYGLEFQVQALCGDVEPDVEGDFGLRVMLLAGQALEGRRTYIGIEANVDVIKCHAFVAQLREFLLTWSSSGHFVTENPDEDRDLQVNSPTNRSHEAVYVET